MFGIRLCLLVSHFGRLNNSRLIDRIHLLLLVFSGNSWYLHVMDGICQFMALTNQLMWLVVARFLLLDSDLCLVSAIRFRRLESVQLNDLWICITSKLECSTPFFLLHSISYCGNYSNIMAVYSNIIPILCK